MFSAKLPSTLAQVLEEAGLYNCPRFYLDRQFAAAIVAGMLFLWLFYDRLPVFSSPLTLNWTLLVSVLIWQPFIEELLFRGVIQGQVSKYKWGQAKILHITSANIITSFLFVAIHLFNSPLLWSLAIFIPSLLYGYFKDMFNSVYPAIVLHGVYNALVIIALYINGNAVF